MAFWAAGGEESPVAMVFAFCTAFGWAGADFWAADGVFGVDSSILSLCSCSVAPPSFRSAVEEAFEESRSLLVARTGEEGGGW